MTQYHVIISGATGGIGSQIAKLVIQDENVIKCSLIYRNEEKFNYLFSRESSPKIEKIQIDMEKNPEKRWSLLSPSHDKIAVRLVIAASTIIPIEHIEALTPHQIIANINTNVISQINLISSVIHNALRLHQSVGIINLNSGAAYRPLSGWSLYSGSKSYLNIFLKTLVKENPEVRVVSYDPGVVDTPMQQIIRNTSKDIFDEVETFKKYQLDAQLNDSLSVAEDIFNRYIREWTANNFEEKYQ